MVCMWFVCGNFDVSPKLDFHEYPNTVELGFSRILSFTFHAGYSLLKERFPAL